MFILILKNFKLILNLVSLWLGLSFFGIFSLGISRDNLRQLETTHKKVVTTQDKSRQTKMSRAASISLAARYNNNKNNYNK